MNYLKLKQENKKLREENEKLRQHIELVHEIMQAEDECIIKLVENTFEEARKLSEKHVFW